MPAPENLHLKKFRRIAVESARSQVSDKISELHRVLNLLPPSEEIIMARDHFRIATDYIVHFFQKEEVDAGS